MTKASREKVSIDNCAQEQIHIPGSIQSFGHLIAFDETVKITRTSENIEEITGQNAASLVGKDLSEILNPEDLERLDQNSNELRRRNAILTLKSGHQVGCILHSAGKEHFLDLVSNKSEGTQIFLAISELSANLSKAKSLEELAKTMVDTIRKVSKFDRVKLYKFDKDWHGEVIAEARAPEMPSYKGMHFPESDIPKQARELYIRNRVRVIADVEDPQSAIYQHKDARPLDLSFSFIRSVSPIHLQYLKNMDIRASMSISIFANGEFWGLIACHHSKARQFDLFEADFYKVAGELLSNRLSELLDLESKNAQAERVLLAQEMLCKMNKENSINPIMERPHSLDSLIKCTGVCAVLGKDILKRNAVPDAESLDTLVNWLERGSQTIFYCDDLPSRYNRDIGSYACGILAVKVKCHSDDKPNWLIWFRPEEALEVDWAGDPFAPKQSSPFGDRLFPRTSFALWKEIKRGHAAPWTPFEIDTAKYLSEVVASFLASR